MQVWITRTETSAVRSAAAVQAAGFTPLVAPLLTLTPASVPHAAPADDATLAFTSQNGVRAFAALTDRREWPVFAVGDATADMARHYGFTDVISASGNVDALAKLIIKYEAESIIHLSGVHVAGDLIGQLTEAGIPAQRTIIYAAQAVKSLPENVIPAIEQGGPLAVMLYSPKAAQVFRAVLRGRDIQNLITVSLSEKIDAGLDGLQLGGRYTAQSPDERAMIAALEVARAKA